MRIWNKVKLGDIVEKTRGICYGVVQPGTYTKNGIPFLRVNNLVDGKITINDVEKITPEIEAKYRRSRLEGNELLVTLVGSLGSIAKTNENMKGWNVARAVGVIPLKQNINRDWIYWYMRSPLIQNELMNIATTSVQATINLKELSEIEIAFPDELTQTRIASILSALDDKIELNRQMNHTLELMAQALFKKYFVDDIDKDNLPVGWRMGRLEDEIEIKHGYAFAGKYFSEEETNDVLLTPGNFKIGGGFNYNKFKFYKGDYPKEYILAFSDLIVTMTDLSKDGDTLGYSALVPEISSKRLLHNQRIGKVIFKDNPKLKFYLYWLMRTESYRAFVVGSATGTTVKHTSPTRICEYTCAIPNDETLSKFENVVFSLYQKEISNNLEIETLSKLRDTLLPKLMSGEVSVEQTAAVA